MTETEFDAAFQDLISRPWPSQKEGARSADLGFTQDVDFVAGKFLPGSDRVAPDFGAVTGASNAPVEGIYPILAAPRVFPDFGTRPTGGVAKSATPLRAHGTHPGTHPRVGSPRTARVDIQTRPEPAAMGFSCTDINTTAAPMRHDITTVAEPVALGFSRMDIQTTAA